MFSYSENGKGETVVFLHGFVEDKSIWDNCISQLSKNFNCIALDLPGSDSTPMDRNYHNLEEVADDINDFLETKEIAKITLLGHSLGGYLALAFGKKYPNKLNGLGLIHSNTVADNDEKKNVRKRLAQALIERGSSDFLKSFFISLTSRKNYARCEDQIEKMNNIGLNLKAEDLAKWSLLMMDRPGSEEFVESLNIPLLFLFGDDDSFYPYNEGIEIAVKCNQFQLSLIRNCGHAGFIEQTEEFNSEIEKYLNWLHRK